MVGQRLIFFPTFVKKLKVNDTALAHSFGHIAKIKKDTPIDIRLGLDLEQQLIDQVLSGEIDCGYALWRSKPALVVPKSATHRENFEQACTLCEKQGWPVVVRSTGGELTPQSEGFINLSIALKTKKKELSIKDSYLIICNAIMQWLAEQNIDSSYSAIDGAFCDGDYNVVINGQKLVGTAQRWKKITDPIVRADGSDMAILMHAVILCDGDLPSMWNISNTFYQACNLPPFIKNEKHISLAQLFNSTGEIFVSNILNSLDKSMSQYIEELTATHFR